MTLSPELAALRDEALGVSCEAYASRAGWPLRRMGGELVGPCPLGGGCAGGEGGGIDRFSINPRENVGQCRQCGIGFNDSISMVQLFEQVGFVEALERITGRSAAAPVDPERQRRLAAEAARREQDREKEAERYRQKARRAGERIWRSARPAAEAVFDYLVRRGLAPDRKGAGWLALRCGLRQIDDLPFLVEVKTGESERRFVTAHRGPAMVAAVTHSGGRFGAVHQTWLDPDAPKGKAEIIHPETGEVLPARKMRGAQRGGAILLFTPSAAGRRRLVLGEGIETTLSALVGERRTQDTAYWAAGSLGNMAGKLARDADGKLLQGVPDFDDDHAFVPPEWAGEIVYLGDERTASTESRLQAGLRRALHHRPALTARLAWPGIDGDFNDMLMGALVTSGEGEVA